MARGVVIEEDNLSIAWAKAFLEVFERNEIAPMVVAINGLDGKSDIEVGSIRAALDDALKANGQHASGTVASTIFPTSLWVPGGDRHHLYKRFERVYPRLKGHAGNRYGTYFQRLIAHGCQRDFAEGVNQLEEILQKREGSVRRKTGFHAAVFDPRKDHAHQTRRGFPCLQHVSFDPSDSEGLAVTGSYVTQHLFEKGYGNYLGLYNLGRFMAGEMGLPLTRLTIIANPACRGYVSKKKLGPLAWAIRSAINGAQRELKLD